jgi:hypothetical protein
MHHSSKTTWIALLIAVASAGACAQTTMGKTRDEVRNELAAATREGTMLQTGEVGLPMREVHPGNYRKQPATAGRTRADVLTELDAARRNGDLLANGDSSLTRSEQQPSQYPQHPVMAGKTRAQVLAELSEARRGGDIVAAGESGLTLREIHPGAYPAAAAAVYAKAPASAPGQQMR